MQIKENGYVFSDDKKLIDLESVCALLKQSYWAQNRSREKVEKTIENSMCFGVYKDGEQVGFARAVTDHATMYWLCDVIIDEKHRGRGLGKALVSFVINSDELKNLSGALGTTNAHTLYERFGFKSEPKDILAKEKHEGTDHDHN